MNEAAEVAAALETSARQELEQESKELFDCLEQSVAAIMTEVDTHLAEVKT